MLTVKFTIQVLASIAVAASLRAGVPVSVAGMSGAIRTTLDAALPTFEPDLQRHYAERMYRVTGDRAYIPSVYLGANESLRLLREDLNGLSDSGYLANRYITLLDELGDGKKGRARRGLFDDRPDLLLSLEMLETAWRLRSYGLTEGEPGRLYDQTLEYLRKQPLADFLLEAEVIRIYGAQAVNAVVYMQDLGLADIEDDFRQRFISLFPDRDDSFLSNAEFENKIYTLTHFILAASGFCQYLVAANEFG